MVLCVWYCVYVYVSVCNTKQTVPVIVCYASAHCPLPSIDDGLVVAVGSLTKDETAAEYSVTCNAGYVLTNEQYNRTCHNPTGFTSPPSCLGKLSHGLWIYMKTCFTPKKGHADWALNHDSREYTQFQGHAYSCGLRNATQDSNVALRFYFMHIPQTPSMYCNGRIGLGTTFGMSAGFLWPRLHFWATIDNTTLCYFSYVMFCIHISCPVSIEPRHILSPLVVTVQHTQKDSIVHSLRNRNRTDNFITCLFWYCIPFMCCFLHFSTAPYILMVV